MKRKSFFSALIALGTIPFIGKKQVAQVEEIKPVPMIHEFTIRGEDLIAVLKRKDANTSA